MSRDPQPRSQRIALATGLDYHLLVWGDDDPALNHTVYLIHGFLDLAWGWAATVRSGLFHHYRVIAPDMRGHGDSDRIGAGGYYYFADYLADLDSLIAQTARGRVSLVGHSMGGMVASYYAGMYADRIYKLALLEGILTPEPSDSIPDRVANWVRTTARARKLPNRVYPDTAAAAAQMQKYDSRLSREIAIELAAHGTRATTGGVEFKHDPLHVTRGPYPFSFSYASQFWRKIICPVLLLEGSESEMTLPVDDYLRRKECIPHARIETITGAGHLLQRHQPEAVGQKLQQFLGK